MYSDRRREANLCQELTEYFLFSFVPRLTGSTFWSRWRSCTQVATDQLTKKCAHCSQYFANHRRLPCWFENQTKAREQCRLLSWGMLLMADAEKCLILLPHQAKVLSCWFTLTLKYRFYYRRCQERRNCDNRQFKYKISWTLPCMCKRWTIYFLRVVGDKTNNHCPPVRTKRIVNLRTLPM